LSIQDLINAQGVTTDTEIEAPDANDSKVKPD